MPKLFHLCAAEPDGWRCDNDTTIHEASALYEGSEKQPQRRQAKVNINALGCDETQRQAIHTLYERRQHFMATYLLSTDSQDSAASSLRDWDLSEGAAEMLESKWKIAWSQTWVRDSGGQTVEQVLYQW
ncbi:hypothetical protein WOLCODRAFT_167849 [Wolfiporia cocos MD-104 SS10]|uniref:Uncharacterized protein n=1 Tax=Wolfiporia cocos (strain MD-104) TaxID=742152 RepID=A0A2H3JH81_WOLCO|nr:hypothetical protein WOLCODRAFT_167849 [Wolfiporia cocos MD-104 SS10]